jgi:ATP-dependent Clp protease ATP-binding subunit ClpC
MPEFITLLLGIVVGFLIHLVAVRIRSGGTEEESSRETAAEAGEKTETKTKTNEAGDRPGIYRIAEKLNEFFQQTAHPSDLLNHELFEKGVNLLNPDRYETADLISYYRGDNPLIACMALEALARRTDDADLLAPVTEYISHVYNWQRFFALRVLERRVKKPAVARLLADLDDSWNNPFSQQFIKDFIRKRIAAGETPRFEERKARAAVDDDEGWLEPFLKEVDGELKTSLADGYRKWQRGRVDIDFLRSVGRVVGPADVDTTDVIESDSLLARVNAIEKALKKDPPRSVLLVGEPGAGKNTTLKVVARRLLEDGWTLFEASGVDIKAGQMYHGQIEQRIQNLVRSLAGKDRVLWIVPSFQELLYAGRHQHSETSILDIMLPHLQNRSIRLIAAIQPGAHERVVQSKPGVKTALETIDYHRMPDRETLDLARRWVERVSPDDGPPLVEERTLAESFQLSQQYLGNRANPGSLLGFLSLTREFRVASDGSGSPITLTLDDLLATLSRLTGLPASILDERQDLNLGALEDFFHRRVMGQPEAATCLVERVAMIKAGLTDPTRPQGVFLFTGPTGTGKTEIAKTLAEFLFGSPDRTIRLDMSEFQSSDSLARILGEAYDTRDRTALVNQIRKQPFSVVLLDEFEKAHERVWDLFLQVFDDGRLTDRQGNVADFRHAIVILTSNVGAESAYNEAIGFGGAPDAIVAEEFEKALKRVFRREFLNRLDRVVVFRPLSKAVMRDVLMKELDLVLQRRGLRNRQWAVEWDASGLDFLLAKGFSARLGARPLKRAIDRYLLSPLAMTIVNHQVPEGDQFLFVRSDGRSIQVEFIDPDAPEPAAAGAPARAAEGGREGPAAAAGFEIRSIVLEPSGASEEVAFLSDVLERLRGQVADEAWRAKKAAALEGMSSPAFWSSNDRFKILGRAEYMDRIEAGIKTSGSLLTRLIGPGPGTRKHIAADLVRRLAQHLYLIQAALEGFQSEQPPDAYVQVEGTRDSMAEARETDAFAARIAAMYRHWAKKRGMALEVMEESGGGDGEPYRFLAAVSGYAAYPLLRDESGLHVLEVSEGSRTTRRFKVRVDIAAQLEAPPPNDAGAHLALARQTLGEAERTRPTIVRRYREVPSPLVRDSLRGWRTGRIDHVLDGDFDLFA